MKQKIKSTMLLFLVCLVVIPYCIYEMSSAKVQLANKLDSTARILTYIVATPREVQVPEGTTKEAFLSQIKVAAYYKKVEEPTEVTNYVTNYQALKDQTGKKRVIIEYSENGCTKKTSVEVNFSKIGRQD